MQWKLVPASDFYDYQQQWDDLNEMNQNLAILNSRFVAPLIKPFFPDNALLAIGSDEANRVSTMLFIHKRGFGRWATVMPSQAPLCLLVHQDQQITKALISSLCQALPGWVLQIDFLQLDSRGVTLPTASQYSLTDYITTGSRPVPESFDDYFKSLGKNLRQNYNKVVNRAAKAEQKLDCYCVTDPEDVAKGVITYGEIEAKSWKAELGTAIEPDNEQGKYYQQMMTQLAETQQACVWYYTIDEQIVACDLCISQNNELIILKTTFDNDFAKASPALQMKVDMLRYYSEHPEAGIKNIEFFGKAMEWHKRLDSTLRPIHHLTWYSSTVLFQLITRLKAVSGR